jgi:ribosome maturation protein Sdo1
MTTDAPSPRKKSKKQVDSSIKDAQKKIHLKIVRLEICIESAMSDKKALSEFFFNNARWQSHNLLAFFNVSNVNN